MRLCQLFYLCDIGPKPFGDGIVAPSANGFWSGVYITGIRIENLFLILQEILAPFEALFSLIKSLLDSVWHGFVPGYPGTRFFALTITITACIMDL